MINALESLLWKCKFSQPARLPDLGSKDTVSSLEKRDSSACAQMAFRGLSQLETPPECLNGKTLLVKKDRAIWQTRSRAREEKTFECCASASAAQIRTRPEFLSIAFFIFFYRGLLNSLWLHCLFVLIILFFFFTQLVCSFMLNIIWHSIHSRVLFVNELKTLIWNSFLYFVPPHCGLGIITGSYNLGFHYS